MPQFSPGELKTAKTPISNPTGRGFNYTTELYLGLPKVTSSGDVPFYLAAGEVRNISFAVTMPQAAGTYPVYLDVFSGGQLIGAYQAYEDVTIGAITGNLLRNPGWEEGFTSWNQWVDGTRGHWFTADLSEYGATPHSGTLAIGFSAAMSGRHSDAWITQVVPWDSSYRGKSYDLSVFTGSFPSRLAHDIEGGLRIMIDDGVGRSETEIYVNWQSWQQHSVRRTLSPSATKLEALFHFVPHVNFHGAGVFLDTASLEEI